MMENLTLLIQMTVIGAALFIVMFLMMNSDESLPRRWAKVRVRVNGTRRNRMPEPREEKEFEAQIFEAKWLLVTGLVAFIAMMMINL
jgi:hypothetical protein